MTVLLGTLVVTAGCAGFGDESATTTTTVTPAPGADNPGSLAGTTTTVTNVTDSLPYRLELQNDLERNVTLTADYATNATTAVSHVYGPGTNASLGETLESGVAYEVEIRSGDHVLWTATLDAGEGYRLVVTEWGRVTVEGHVQTD